MDRAALARELFDCHQEMRDQLQRVKIAGAALERLKPDSPFPPDVLGAAKKLTALVARAEAAITGYCATEPVTPA
jgi:hypothetical protein